MVTSAVENSSAVIAPFMISVWSQPSTVIVGGQVVIIGAAVSFMVIVCTQVLVLPQSSSAVNVLEMTVPQSALVITS